MANEQVSPTAGFISHVQKLLKNASQNPEIINQKTAGKIERAGVPLSY
jgi:hypothetical protein